MSSQTLYTSGETDKQRWWIRGRQEAGDTRGSESRFCWYQVFKNGEYCVFGDVETGARTSKPSFVNPAKRTNPTAVKECASKMNPFNKNKMTKTVDNV